MLKRLLAIMTAALIIAAIAVPGFAKDEIKIAYVEWDCAAASTNLVQAVLQEKMGYEVEIIPVAAAAMWQAVGTGDVDGMVTAWLPVTHADYLAKVKDKVENLGPIVGGAKLGWAVPSYVKAESIADLNKYADKFDGRIIGIDPGAGLMRLSEQAVKDYDLKLELMEGSGATMTAALSNAIKNNEWVVVTAWSPHWMFGKWDLKYLADPKGTLGGEEHIDTIVRKGLSKDKPEVYAFLDKFEYKDAVQMQTLMAWNQEPGADRYENAKRFIKEFPETVDSWLK
ncbi:glycine betaine ABC transporter substrate-binding protein [Desulfovibrio ferrophilus]|uniref:Glycine/betaine ABC transporter substrate-binding protein n=1 Tax=Desulfovibrio ferrophilus TaxID=241368 RepID=A0A2Z6AUX1_9BACT|nr:glycine betaine ABC transporter substrate-binding protein [Desulfovibrio ferrophilus]BBD07042.1 glycine/betaine ABC transporter substrate-binding protein [Desulfovibrio ferrophilus]